MKNHANVKLAMLHSGIIVPWKIIKEFTINPSWENICVICVTLILLLEFLITSLIHFVSGSNGKEWKCGNWEHHHQLWLFHSMIKYLWLYLKDFIQNKVNFKVWLLSILSVLWISIWLESKCHLNTIWIKLYGNHLSSSLRCRFG